MASWIPGNGHSHACPSACEADGILLSKFVTCSSCEPCRAWLCAARRTRAIHLCKQPHTQRSVMVLRAPPYGALHAGAVCCLCSTASWAVITHGAAPYCAWLADTILQAYTQSISLMYALYLVTNNEKHKDSQKSTLTKLALFLCWLNQNLQWSSHAFRNLHLTFALQ